MRPEDKQQYLDMIPRVFVRALRDPNGNEEYELSEGEATDLLRRREAAASAPYVQAIESLLPILVGVRHSVGLGKTQLARIDAATKLVAESKLSASEPAAQ